jgi:hypothetical protein
MAYGSKGGENVKFKDKKLVSILKLKIYICWSNVFALQRPFLKL